MKKRPETYLLFVIHPCSNSKSKWQIIEANKMLICQSETTANSGTAPQTMLCTAAFMGLSSVFGTGQSCARQRSVETQYTVDIQQIVDMLCNPALFFITNVNTANTRLTVRCHISCIFLLSSYCTSSPVQCMQLRIPFTQQTYVSTAKIMYVRMRMVQFLV